MKKQAENLSDAEIERCFAGTVLANKNIKFAKQFRDNNTLKLTKKEMIAISKTGKSFAQVTTALNLELKKLNSSLEQLKRVSKHKCNYHKSKFF